MTSKTDGVRLCVNCQHHEHILLDGAPFHRCNHPSTKAAPKLCLVTGEMLLPPKLYFRCNDMRAGDACGQDGHLYQERSRDGLWKRLWE